MINVRFDLIESLSNKDKDHTGFFRLTSPAVPEKGEVVNIGGNPYIVMDRSWYFEPGSVFAYIRVLKAF